MGRKINLLLILIVFFTGMSQCPTRVFSENSAYKKILPSHPRIIINEYNKLALQKKAMGILSSLFKRFINAQHSRGEDTQAICHYIYSQAYAYQMTGEIKWADNAISAMEQMRTLFDTYGTSPDSSAHCLEALAIGFDWCYDRIVEMGKRDRFISLIKEFANRAQQEFQNGIFTDFHNYATNFEVAVLFAGLALYQEDEKAIDYLDWARGIVETGYQLNRTTYKLVDSINYVDGACNWENSTYQRTSLFAILKYIDGWDTATGGGFEAWNTTFKNIENAGYYFIYSVQPNNVLVPLGDNAYLEVNYKDINNLAALQGAFKNPYFTTFLDKYFRWKSGKFAPEIPCDQGNQLQIFYLLWYDPYIKSKPFELLPLSRKFGNDIIMRTSWGEEGTYITFRAGMHWGGHSHLDHGSFTIFKSSPLVIDTGYYDLWLPGSHIWDYWKRTVAHNTILIFDSKEKWPTYAGERLNDGGQRMAFRKYCPPYTDRHGYFASGSSNEPLSIAYLNGHIDEFKMGEIEAYEFDDEFVYIRADLTGAYNNSYSGKGDNQNRKANLVKREFIYLKPDYVIVLDRVNTPDKSLKKSWLLHFGQYRALDKSAPYIQTAKGWVRPKAAISSYDSDLIRIDNGKGRLFCKTLLPQKHILEVVGGEGYEFWVNGKNIPIAATSIRDREEPGAWRIEIRPAISKEKDIFLHVLYPCDVSVEAMLETSCIETEDIVGVHIENQVVLFSKNGNAQDNILYSTEGKDVLSYHLLFNLAANTKYGVKVVELDTNKEGQFLINSTPSGALKYSIQSIPKKRLRIAINRVGNGD